MARAPVEYQLIVDSSTNEVLEIVLLVSSKKNNQFTKRQNKGTICEDVEQQLGGSRIVHCQKLLANR